MLVHRSALVPHSARRMFDLVADVPAYPQFLPWCRAAAIEAVEGDGVVRASVELAKGGVHKRFTTRNRNRPAESIAMELVEGPFHHLRGEWRFIPLSDDACKVTLDMDFEFSNRLVEMAFGPIFMHVVERLIDAFIERARSSHGR